MSDDGMLQLYHAEPNAESARVMICLTEKALRFSSHFVDVLGFEEHTAPLRGLDCGGEIPLLLHGDAAFTGPTQVCEYLEEAFPERPLMPRGARTRWRVRIWQKYLDDGLAASVSELAWDAYGAAALAGRDRSALERSIAALPAGPRRAVWSAVLTGLAAPVLAQARDRVREGSARAEADLAGGAWLAGTELTLADIAAFAYFNFLPRLCPDIVNPERTPLLLGWLNRILSRPAVRAALALGRSPDPFAAAIPGPEQIRWG